MTLSDSLNHRKWMAGPLAALLILMLAPAQSSAQYTCFPSCDSTDSRMMSIAGVGAATMVGGMVAMEIGVPAGSTSFEIGIFDGESTSRWDGGATTALTFTLYADKYGDGTGTFQVGQWSGSTMTDNAWYTVTVNNDANALAPNGQYLYTLRVSLDDTTTNATTAFKVRTTGNLTVKANQGFNIMNPLSNTPTAQIVYPLFPVLTPTTYDGSWTIHLDVPAKLTELTVFDGDMDFGRYDASVLDSDDPNTSNSSLESWAVGSQAALEGVANGIPATDINGTPTSGNTSGAPAEDDRRPVFRRTPDVIYTIVDPANNSYTNSNPSGNLEWEKFTISTSTFNSSTMDHHADSLIPGIYEVQISGMDLGNLNAWRFFQNIIGTTNAQQEVLGVDEAGGPVGQLQPYELDGTVYYDADTNGTQGSGEPGIPSITINIDADRNNDGQVDKKFSVVTDSNGIYSITNLYAGSYLVTVDTASLDDDAVPVGDPDGTGTANRATILRDPSHPSSTANFTYRRQTQPPTSSGTRTRGYWVNHEENWPVSGLTLGGVSYTKAQLLTILKKPTKGDKTYSLAAQLIATKLNLASGTESSCITSDVAAADTWLASHPIGSKPNNSAWNQIDEVHEKLDSYNNGNECAPHMD